VCLNGEQTLGVSVQLMNVVPQFFLTLNSAVIYGIGGLRVMNGSMTIGELMAFSTLITFFLNPVNQLVNLGGSLQDVQGMFNRLDDVFKYPVDEGFKKEQEEQTDLNNKIQEKLYGSISLKNVSFGYNPLEPPLIEDFSLELTPGKRIALVGTSGSGKSTMSRIITGLQKPWSGEILFDGKPRSSFPFSVLNQSIALVASSSIKMLGFIESALAISRRCRWPPDKLLPPS